MIPKFQSITALVLPSTFIFYKVYHIGTLYHIDETITKGPFPVELIIKTKWKIESTIRSLLRTLSRAKSCAKIGENGENYSCVDTKITKK